MCGLSKPVTAFARRKGSRDGLRGECRQCGLLAHKRKRTANPGIYLNAGRRWKAKNPEQHAKINAEWVSKNRDKSRAYTRKNRLKNIERRREYSRRHSRENPAYYAAAASKRRAVILNATPIWANSAAVQFWYDAAHAAVELFGVPVHVDHIVPMQSKIVCGLHCEQNMQLLPGAENSRKFNRHWPDMP